MEILWSANLQWVLVSMLFLGMAAGTIGCLSYWKRQSLMSDALSHAALPGVVVAFMLLGEKQLPAMIAGAAVSSLLGAFFIQMIRSSSRIKEDTAMGMVLSVFFGLGIMLVTMVNRTGNGNQSGLDSFIFGQAASMVRKDVFTMLALAALVLLVVFLACKEWKLFLFDPAFAAGLGLSMRLMNSVYLAVLVLVIVIGIQAVGVILMAALLIIPPASARYWTKSFRSMLAVAGLFGGGAGVSGTLFSSMGAGWPTGPFIVLAASFLFLISLVFGVEKGLLVRAFQLWIQRRRLAESETAIIGTGVKRG